MNARFRSIVLALALLAVLAKPAAAQGGSTIAAGVSFWNADSSTSTGLTVDYARDVTASPRHPLGLVLDLALGRFDQSSALSLSAGARVGGTAGGRVRWHGQALVGVLRTGPRGDVADLCNALESQCNRTRAVFTPGLGIDVKTSNRLGLRAQVDFPIWKLDPGTQRSARFWLGLSWAAGR